MTSELNLTQILQIAYDILSNAKSPMHVNDIATIAVNTNKNMGMKDDELATKLSSSLSQHLNTKSPIFAKVANKNGSMKRGIYRLKKQTVKTPKLPAPKFEELSTNYTGKAGEYAVMSELLFWGFNVSLMAVDEGIDIIATKENKYFHIQVKATTEKADSISFNFTVKRDVFEANNNSTTFYVLVLRSKQHTEYIVLPSTEIDRLLKLGKVTGATSISLRVTYDAKSKKYLLNGKEDLSPHRNAFNQIR
ncbi:hypothetical protein [Hydrogenophaga sp.]|uniref:hypothetical protein n=1 Tax=Hydrogenophaga sp. TaxID=1904254 RepID=UPI00273320B5|nr:hypothetical protein [Hydrogenophaga sp.]MDP1573265.1 hypothetical protein [Pseudomonadota bacterium]MDP1959967.1 hypothetical protein [Methylotenera sp.]MDP3321993.1 hypothetical protein [Hydrogenophaga sp.]MDP3884329.1 hypothetical protein [Hydrogenophaga sp.]